MNQYNFVLVVRGSHSISDEVKVLSNPWIPEQKCLKAGGLGIQGLTGSRYPTRPELFFKYPTRPDPKIENDWVPGN